MAAAPLLLLAAGCSESGDDRPPASGAAADTEPSPVRDEIAFTFTGGSGEAGCRYDGPSSVGTDTVSTMVNRSPGEAYVTLARLAPGAGPEDFTAYVDTLGDEYPVRVPPEHHDPSTHEWMDGGWRQVHTAGAGDTHRVTSTTFAEGDYVMFCFRDADAGGSDLWPLGHLRVAAQ